MVGHLQLVVIRLMLDRYDEAVIDLALTGGAVTCDLAVLTGKCSNVVVPSVFI